MTKRLLGKVVLGQTPSPPLPYLREISNQYKSSSSYKNSTSLVEYWFYIVILNTVSYNRKLHILQKRGNYFNLRDK